MTTDCRGCYTYMLRENFPYDTSLCSLISDLSECPCLQCIVKSMCSEACENFKEFTGEDKE